MSILFGLIQCGAKLKGDMSSPKASNLLKPTTQVQNLTRMDMVVIEEYY